MPTIEVFPRLSLWRIGRSLNMQKSYLAFHKHQIGGDDARHAVLKELVRREIVFLYEQDVRLMVENPNAFNPFYPCEYVEEGERAPDVVPFYPAGENPWMAEYAATHDLPQEVTLGGPETMYPEYRRRLKQLPAAVFTPVP